MSQAGDLDFSRSPPPAFIEWITWPLWKFFYTPFFLAADLGKAELSLVISMEYFGPCLTPPALTVLRLLNLGNVKPNPKALADASRRHFGKIPPIEEAEAGAGLKELIGFVR